MNENSGLISWISESAPNPQDEPFFSREIRTPAIEASLFLEKNEGTQRLGRISRGKQGYADNLCVFLEENRGTQINFAYFSKKTGVRR